MTWTNENALEFLELLKSEPCLWNPNLHSYRNRSNQNDSWRRIIKSLSFTATTDELKKKKESLLGYYRIHINKYKKSLKSGQDVYTTNWFAFELMDSFLRPIYDTTNTESCEEKIIKKAVKEVFQVSTPKPLDCHHNSKKQNRRNKECFTSQTQNQNYETPPETINVSRQIDNTFELQSGSSKKRELDEYDHFACMIATKIRKLENPDDRELLMHSIQNITFEFYMKNKRVTSGGPSTEQSSPIHVFVCEHSEEESTNSPE